jgi:hypothetical protein
MGDLHALISGNIEIVLHVTLGIHDNHGLGSRTAYDVRKATHARNGYLLEIHTSNSFALWVGQIISAAVPLMRILAVQGDPAEMASIS